MINLLHGDCIALMKSLPENSVDSVVTDPPYGIRFMGKAWDGEDIEARAEKRRKNPSQCPGAGPNGGHKSAAAEAGKYDLSPAGMIAFQEFSREWAAEAMRVLKPGGFLIAFSSTRTYHRMASGVEMAGFEIRDQIPWIFGTGFPKSLNLKGELKGWGTALKPAHEPTVLARKPFKGTVAENASEFGTGALNIDASKIDSCDQRENGRWPANVILSEDGANELDRQSGHLKSGAMDSIRKESFSNSMSGKLYSKPVKSSASEGGASRFFYVAKPNKAERNSGLSGMPKVASGVKNSSGRGFSERDPKKEVLNENFHPTVKPVTLMKYLIRLVTPPGGTVLDPFLGSGTTGMAAKELGFSFIGCELESDYLEIAKRRIGNLPAFQMELSDE